MAKRDGSRTIRRGVFESGRSVRKKFLLAVVMAGLLPLLFLIYLGLPVLLPTTVTAPLYPKGAPVFVALLIFVAFIELAGFFIIYSNVLGHMQRNLDDELERLRASGSRSDTIVEELRRENFRLREMSHTDELTEVGNRRSFDRRVREEISRSSRFGHSFSLLMIDIDGFKKFNDEFGHPKGDAVLRALGALMRSASREGDVPCRVGGEEFAFILPETGKAEGLVFAERFRRRVESSVIAPDSLNPITVSIGLAAFPQDGRNPDEIVWAADEALYESKRAGRNRVTALPAEERRGPGELIAPRSGASRYPLSRVRAGRMEVSTDDLRGTQAGITAVELAVVLVVVGRRGVRGVSATVQRAPGDAGGGDDPHGHRASRARRLDPLRAVRCRRERVPDDGHPPGTGGHRARQGRRLRCHLGLELRWLLGHAARVVYERLPLCFGVRLIHSMRSGLGWHADHAHNDGHCRVEFSGTVPNPICRTSVVTIRSN